MEKFQAHEILPEVTLRPGQRLGVIICASDGTPVGQIIEVRATPQPQETPLAFSVDVVEHASDICKGDGGCPAVWGCLSIPPEENAVYEEILRQRAAERDNDLAQHLANSLGIEVSVLGEHGMATIKPVPPST